MVLNYSLALFGHHHGDYWVLPGPIPASVTALTPNMDMTTSLPAYTVDIQVDAIDIVGQDPCYYPGGFEIRRVAHTCSGLVLFAVHY